MSSIPEANPRDTPLVALRIDEATPAAAEGGENLEDADHPSNWPTAAKAILVTALCVAIFSVSLASSLFGPASPLLAEQFDVSETVMQLGVSLFVAGFSAGPILWGPLAQMIGSKIPMIIGSLGCGLMHIPLGLARDVPTILVSRFLAGAFGSAILAIGAGTVAGPFTSSIDRASALAASSTVINIGSVFGPIIASFVVARVTWRWLAWLTIIWFACIVPPIFLIRDIGGRRKPSKEEQTFTLEPGGRKHSLRRYWAGVKSFSRDYLKQPFVLFCKEPILIVLTVYLTFVYGVLYLAYQMFPLAYVERGWRSDIATLPLLAVFLGLLASSAVVITFMNTWYKRRWEQNNHHSPAEHFLPPMILGSFVIPPALLWFGWSMETHWASQALASAFVGFGLQLVFMSGLIYIGDVYRAHIVPAISIHVTFRSIFSASFPLWTRAMYDALGVSWMATALAGFSLLMVPFPLLFFVYGSKIRSWSTYSSRL